MAVLAGAEPFAHTGSTEAGFLLCHGFTGTPASMRPWGDHLADAGYTVRCPLLPGHGTRWQDMNRTGWEDWYGAVREELLALFATCETVFVAGMSMGGTLTLRLAEEFGDRIAGIVLVNPSVLTLRWDAKLLPVLSRILPSVPGVANDIAKPGETELAYSRTPVRAAASLAKLWKLTRADLGKVTQPVLLLHSAVDHIVEPVNSQVILNGIGSEDVTEVVLENSFHVATQDHDAGLIFTRTVDFARSVRRAGQVDAG
ncbi:carboxylesterase [Amycolatopsis lurida]|uniref:Esterase n=1 Tax=Amycolatopsis lurida NRRL 2430 TaxID=1460371 RepID=A0A2P2FHC2_AMYLU|nr:alpha/beta fold hydrolase [Amycolatopsis lurida]KFU76128.1 esterase [Amycolatopsis lurida NRRL 2430]SEC75289.1 carboxylesterase [Amycolatopsis lurida]